MSGGTRKLVQRRERAKSRRATEIERSRAQAAQSVIKRDAAYVLAVDVSAPAETDLDHALVAVLAGDVQTRVAVAIRSVDWDARREQLLHLMIAAVKPKREREEDIRIRAHSTKKQKPNQPLRVNYAKPRRQR